MRKLTPLDQLIADQREARARGARIGSYTVGLLLSLVVTAVVLAHFFLR